MANLNLNLGMNAKKMKKPTVVIFDMDGTSVRHVNPAFLHFLEMLDNGLYRRERVDIMTIRTLLIGL